MVRKGRSEDGTGDIRRVLRGGPTFVSHKKEREVHTQTSSAVLFIKGASLETMSKCPAAGKRGRDYSEPLEGVSLGVGAVRKGGRGLGLAGTGFTTKGGAACSCGPGADASLTPPAVHLVPACSLLVCSLTVTHEFHKC